MPICRGLALLVLLLPLLFGVAQARPLNVGGTGGALGTLRALAQAFEQETGTPVIVRPSLGTLGGLRAMAGGKLDIAVIGRDLTEAERARGPRRFLVTRTPFGLATSIQDPPPLAAEVIASYLLEPRMRWPNGIPVRIVLRPAADTDYQVIYAAFPGAEAAVAQLRQRQDIPIAATDQENLDLAETIPGSLVGTTLAQVITERRNLRFIPLNGIRPSLEAMEAGVYSASKSFHFLVGANPSEEATAFAAFITSPSGLALLRRCGNLP
jgi:phosphate transport system substrate-binding protein